MIISLMGMSGCGKSYLTRRLRDELGFRTFDCDAIIAKRLGEATGNSHFAVVGDVAGWMGQPWTPGYTDRARFYLDFEAAVLTELLDELASESRDERGAHPGAVIDTTGSLIYTSEELVQRLRRESHLVYLEVIPSGLQHLVSQYFSDPKPVIWGPSFSQRHDETPEVAVERSYVELLGYRSAEYRRYAELIVRIDPQAPVRLEPTELIRAVEQYLSSRGGDAQDAKGARTGAMGR